MPKCCHCSLELTNWQLLRKHYNNFHAHEQYFQCMEENCFRSFSSVNSINKHRSKVEHSRNFDSNNSNLNQSSYENDYISNSISSISNSVPPTSTCASNNLSSNVQVSPSFPEDPIYDIPPKNTSHIINFMAKLYNISNIPRSQIDEILHNIQELFENEIDDLILSLRNKNIEIDDSIQEALEKKILISRI